MIRLTETALRLLAGLLGAGLLAPFTLLLPAPLQGRLTLLVVAVACVGAALGWKGRGNSS